MGGVGGGVETKCERQGRKERERERERDRAWKNDAEIGLER